MTPFEEMEAIRAEAAASRRGGAQASQQPAPLSVDDDDGLEIHRNTREGTVLRAEAMAPQNEKYYQDATGNTVFGEPPEERERRLYGSISMPERKRPGVGSGLARSTAQGLSYATADEGVAAATAALAKASGRYPDRNYNDLYGSYLARERDKIRMFREDSPVLAYGSEAAGALVPSVATGGLVTAGNTLGKLGGYGGLGLTEGAAYGFNMGEGGFGPRAQNTMITAPLGAVAGIGSVPIASGVGKLSEAISRASAARNAGVPASVQQFLTETMDADGTFSGSGAQNIRMAGPDAMLVDSGPAARQILDVAVQRSGKAGAGARQAVEGRATRANEVVTESLDAAFGEPTGVRETARGIAADTRPGRTEAYDAAFRTPINYASEEGFAIEDVLRRIPQETIADAVKRANASMQEDGITNLQIRATIKDNGEIDFDQPLNVEQLNQIKIALQRIGREKIDTFGRSTDEGARANRLALRLRNAISNAVPAYGVAVERGGDKIAMDNALELGGKLFRPQTTREIVREQLANANPAEREAAAAGVRAFIDEKLANVKMAISDSNMDAREAAKAVTEFSSRANKEKIIEVIGPDAADVFFAQFERAAKSLELRAGIADNSKTFVRTAIDERMNQEATEGAFNALRQARPIEAPRRVAAAFMGRSERDIRKLTDRNYQDLVRALTEKTGPDAADLLNRLGIRNQVPERTAANSTAMAGALLGASRPAQAPYSVGQLPRLTNTR